MKTAVNKIANVTIPVTNQDAMIDFYVDKLGFTKRGQSVPPMFWFRDAEGNTLLMVQ